MIIVAVLVAKDLLNSNSYIGLREESIIPYMMLEDERSTNLAMVQKKQVQND
jgi:hypothetical protein